MAKIPENVNHTEWWLSSKPPHQGKVRDTFDLGDGKLMPVATDRISCFDFVLNGEVRQKGEVLCAMNHFWRTKVFGSAFPNDMVASGQDIFSHLDKKWLQISCQLARRAVIIKTAKMFPVESIVRGYLTGSAVKPYQKDGLVCGHRLPAGLLDGDQLPYSLYTPTDKAEEGHDEHIDADDVSKSYGIGLERLALQLYQLGARYALERGIVLVDTKFEFGRLNDLLCIADEVLTPDSSRYWELTAWQNRQPGIVPPAYDKQYVREWCKEKEIDKRDPKLPEEIEWVQSIPIPDFVLQRTRQIYRYIFWRLTGFRLENYQQDNFGVEYVRPSVDIVVGSESDLVHVWPALEAFDLKDFRVHVCSCHRNPEMLAQYAKSSYADVIIAGAGMAAALPGVLKSWLVYNNKVTPVIGVAFPGKDEAANQAAVLSIEQLPGRPVELDKNGKAYFGSEGLYAAIVSAINDEFLPAVPAAKQAVWDIKKQ